MRTGVWRRLIRGWEFLVRRFEFEWEHGHFWDAVHAAVKRLSLMMSSFNQLGDG